MHVIGGGVHEENNPNPIKKKTSKLPGCFMQSTVEFT